MDASLCYRDSGMFMLAQRLYGDITPALANDVTRKELTVLVTNLAFYAGWPVVSAAIPILRKAFEDADMQQPKHEEFK